MTEKHPVIFLFTYSCFYPIIPRHDFRERSVHEHFPGSLFFHELQP